MLRVSAADDRPKPQGNVAAVSKIDIELISGAAKSWLQKRHTTKPGEKNVDHMSLINVMDHDTAQVHVDTVDSGSGWAVTMLLRVRRVNGIWKADDIATVTRLGSFYHDVP